MFAFGTHCSELVGLIICNGILFAKQLCFQWKRKAALSSRGCLCYNQTWPLCYFNVNPRRPTAFLLTSITFISDLNRLIIFAPTHTSLLHCVNLLSSQHETKQLKKIQRKTNTSGYIAPSVQQVFVLCLWWTKDSEEGVVRCGPQAEKAATGT